MSFTNHNLTPKSSSEHHQNVTTQSESSALDLIYPSLSGAQFEELARRVQLPNLSFHDIIPKITHDLALNRKIRSWAEARGYIRRFLPANCIALEVVDGYKLQPLAARAWLALKQASLKAEGEGLYLVSGFRDYDYQAKLFLEDLVVPYDEARLQNRLRHVSPPGYSKHHTGYTIDIAQSPQGLEKFVETTACSWLAAHNFANAKRYGWLPSYPPDGGRQGPDPEPWEFIYVGQDNILSYVPNSRSS